MQVIQILAKADGDQQQVDEPVLTLEEPPGQVRVTGVRGSGLSVCMNFKCPLDGCYVYIYIYITYTKQTHAGSDVCVH